MPDTATALWSDWHRIDQSMTDSFAGALGTGPHEPQAQPPLVDGAHLLSLLAQFAGTAMPQGSKGKACRPYGFEKVRFLSEVAIGVRLRARFTLLGRSPCSAGKLQRYAVAIEAEGAPRPVLTAEWLLLTPAAEHAAA